MKKSIIFILTIFFTLFSCEETTTDVDNETLKATVIGKGIDCGDTYLIKFNENTSNIPENTFDNIFYAINLPEEYKEEGLEVSVEFREPKKNEYATCTTMGPSYGQLFIEKVE